MTMRPMLILGVALTLVGGRLLAAPAAGVASGGGSTGPTPRFRDVTPRTVTPNATRVPPSAPPAVRRVEALSRNAPNATLWNGKAVDAGRLPARGPIADGRLAPSAIDPLGGPADDAALGMARSAVPRGAVRVWSAVPSGIRQEIKGLARVPAPPTAGRARSEVRAAAPGTPLLTPLRLSPSGRFDRYLVPGDGGRGPRIVEVPRRGDGGR